MTDSEGEDDIVRSAAEAWASDWRPGMPAPYGVIREGNFEPPIFKASVFVNGRPVYGPERPGIPEAIADRRMMLIQFKRVTKMNGKRKTQAKYGENVGKTAPAPTGPWVTHIKELLAPSRAIFPLHPSEYIPPLRHLCPVILSVKIHGVPVTDRFLWSALLIDTTSTNIAAESLGYGAAALNAYCSTLLVDAGLLPNSESVTQLSAAAIQQLDMHRSAALVPDEGLCVDRARGKRFDRFCRIELSDESSGFYEKITWNCWAPDATVSDFIRHLVSENTLKPGLCGILEIQMFTQAIAHRQKFLDAQPHIHTALQRVFNNLRQDGRLEAKRQERLQARKRQRIPDE